MADEMEFGHSEDGFDFFVNGNSAMKRKSTTLKKVSPLKSHAIDVVIETPKGSRNKFAYDPQSGYFKLSKILAEGMMFPYDFGFVPSTKAEDGDPIDVLVLIEEPTFPGCLLQCTLIGVIEATQKEESGKLNRNDRLIAVARESIVYSGIKHISHVNPAVLKHIEAFFVNYQKLRNVQFTILGRRGPDRAGELLAAAGFGTQAA